jgi:hypothetical protein
MAIMVTLTFPLQDGKQAEFVTAQDVSRELLYSAEAQLSDQLT